MRVVSQAVAGATPGCNGETSTPDTIRGVSQTVERQTLHLGASRTESNGSKPGKVVGTQPAQEWLWANCLAARLSAGRGDFRVVDNQGAHQSQTVDNDRDDGGGESHCQGGSTRGIATRQPTAIPDGSGDCFVHTQPLISNWVKVGVVAMAMVLLRRTEGAAGITFFDFFFGRQDTE